jgi:hypothetical protein
MSELEAVKVGRHLSPPSHAHRVFRLCTATCPRLNPSFQWRSCLPSLSCCSRRHSASRSTFRRMYTCPLSCFSTQPIRSGIDYQKLPCLSVKWQWHRRPASLAGSESSPFSAPLACMYRAASVPSIISTCYRCTHPASVVHTPSVPASRALRAQRSE